MAEDCEWHIFPRSLQVPAMKKPEKLIVSYENYSNSIVELLTSWRSLNKWAKLRQLQYMRATLASFKYYDTEILNISSSHGTVIAEVGLARIQDSHMQT